MTFTPIKLARTMRRTQRATAILSYTLVLTSAYLLVQGSWQMASFAILAFALCRLNILACEVAIELAKQQVATLFNLLEGVDSEYLPGIFTKLAKAPATEAEFEAFKIIAKTDPKTMQALVKDL